MSEGYTGLSVSSGDDTIAKIVNKAAENLDIAFDRIRPHIGRISAPQGVYRYQDNPDQDITGDPSSQLVTFGKTEIDTENIVNKNKNALIVPKDFNYGQAMLLFRVPGNNTDLNSTNYGDHWGGSLDLYIYKNGAVREGSGYPKVYYSYFRAQEFHFLSGYITTGYIEVQPGDSFEARITVRNSGAGLESGGTVDFNSIQKYGYQTSSSSEALYARKAYLALQLRCFK